MKMNPTTPWLLLYIVVNIFAAGMMLDTGELIGDVAGVPLTTSIGMLIWITILVVVSYIIILGPFFDFISRIEIPKINFSVDDSKLGERIGAFLIILQLGFMLFNWVEGVNVAGSNNTRSNSIISLLWVLIPVDALFIIYYGMYRENKYFKINLVIWIFSNIMRGWSGVFLVVVFFEWCRAMQNKKINFLKIIGFAAIILAIYPLILNMKWLFRSIGAGLEPSIVIEGFIGALADPGYFFMITNGIEHIIARLQVTSVAVEVMQLSSLLQSEFLNGNIAPFWKEGLLGIVYDKAFLNEKILSIGVAFTQYADFSWDFEVGDWNTNVGYVSWFIIAPYLAPVYILYTLFLCGSSFFLVKLIGDSTLSRNMLWYIWLAYLMPPWPGVFIQFLYALCVFLVIKLIVSRLPSIRIFP